MTFIDGSAVGFHAGTQLHRQARDDLAEQDYSWAIRGGWLAPFVNL